MNLHIRTDNDGKVIAYSLDFQANEYAAAFDTIKSLTPIREPLNTKIGQKLIPIPQENAIPAPAPPPVKLKKEAFDISAESLHTLSALLRPSVRKAFKSIDLSYSNWTNMRTYHRYRTINDLVISHP